MTCPRICATRWVLAWSSDCWEWPGDEVLARRVFRTRPWYDCVFEMSEIVERSKANKVQMHHGKISP